MNLLDSIKRKLGQIVSGAKSAVQKFIQPKPAPKPPSFNYASPKVQQYSAPKPTLNLRPAIQSTINAFPVLKLVQTVKQNVPRIQQFMKSPLPRSVQRIVNQPTINKVLTTAPRLANKFGSSYANATTYGLVQPKMSDRIDIPQLKGPSVTGKGYQTTPAESLGEKIAGGAGTVAGFLNPFNPVNKAFGAMNIGGKILSGGAKIVAPKLVPKIATTTAGKIAGGLTSEALQTAAYAGAKKLSEKAGLSPESNMPLWKQAAMGVAGRTVFGGVPSFLGKTPAFKGMQMDKGAIFENPDAKKIPQLIERIIDKKWSIENQIELDQLVKKYNINLPKTIKGDPMNVLQEMSGMLTKNQDYMYRETPGYLGIVGKPTLPSTPTEAIPPKQYQPQDLFDLLKFKGAPGTKERGFVTTVKEAPTTAPEVAKQVQGTYQPITNQGTLTTAQKIVLDNPDLAKTRVFKEPLTAETNVIGQELMRKAQNEKRFDDATEIAEILAKKGTEAGQAVQAFSIWSRLTPEGMLNYAAKKIQEGSKKITLGKLIGNKSPKLTPEDTAKITDLMTRANKTGNEQEKATLIKETMEVINNKIPWGVSDIVDTYRYNNMLSSPLTQFRNLWNNALTTFIVKPATLVTEGRPKEALKYEAGALKSIPEAIDNFVNSFKGKGELDLSKLDIKSEKAKQFPMILGWPSRLMESTDQFFKTIIKSGEMARGKGTEEAISNAQYSLLRSDLKPKGQGYVLNALDNIPKGLYELRKVPFLGWTIPFLKTPFNFAKMWLEYSPMGVATIPGSADKRGQIGKAILGSVVSMVGMKVALEGRTTWSAPTDPKEKELFYASGRKPFSILMGDKWVPMATLGPLAWAMALPAAHQYYQKESKTSLSDTDMEKVGKELSSLLYFFSQSTPMEGLGSFVQMAEGNMDMNLSRIAARNLGQLKPLEGMMNYISRIVDPIYRKAKTFEEQMKADVPFLTKELPAYTTPEGEPSKRGLGEFVLPYGGSTNVPKYEGQLKEVQGIRRELEPFKKAAKEADLLEPKAVNLYKELKAMPPTEANARAKEIRKTNPNLYNQIKQMVKDEKAGVTISDKAVKGMDLEPRTNYIVSELNKIGSAKDKNAKIKEWQSKGIVTSGVMKKLKEAKAKGTLLNPTSASTGISGAAAVDFKAPFSAQSAEYRPDSKVPLPSTPLGLLTGNKGRFTQGFGARPQVYRAYGLAGHEGEDYVLPENTSVASPFKTAIVEKVDYDPSGYGKYVGLRNPQTNEYILLGHFNTINVKQGQTVSLGQPVGLSGGAGPQSGHSDAPHVHISYTPNYQTRLARSGGYGGFSNPSQFLGRKIT